MSGAVKDLTVEELDEFRRELIGYDIEGNANCHLSDANVERLIAAARKGIEDWQPIEIAKEDRNLTIQIAYKAGPSWCIRQGWWDGEPGIWTDGQHPYRPSHWKRLPSPPTPQKPEPSGRAELVRRFNEWTPGDMKAGEGMDHPSGSVEGLVERIRGWRARLTYALHKSFHADIEEALEALKRMEQERERFESASWQDGAEISKLQTALKVADDLIAEARAESSRLSLEVRRLKKVAEDYIRELTTATQNAAACASLPIASSARIEARVRLEQLETKLRDARNALAGGAEK